MFGLFKNNKPEIQKQINNAIYEEKKRLKSISEDINSKLSNNEEINTFQYNFNLIIPTEEHNIYKKEFLSVDGASSREMFQTINKICPDAEYNVDDDTATGTVKGFKILLMRHKILRKSSVSVLAELIDVEGYINQCIEEYNSSVNTKIPEFIKKAIGD